MTKKQIREVCKAHNIKNVLFVHLNGFEHSIGFGTPENYHSVSYSNYTNETYGYINENEKIVAETLFKNVPHYCYKCNAKEILLWAKKMPENY